ncbi:MAG: SDR family NAD(P)-dependent oxidoreductase [Candidatus Sumerlaeia bacterium]|nr:SDR family NAD(P)-dependent oxidoreductase [Candidatus Sumerlaeia bacterium]
MSAASTAPSATASPVVEPNGRLAGKVAVVTGGTRGLGLAIAKAYAREGAKILIAARTDADLKNAAAEISALGAEVVSARVDLADAGQASRLFIAATRGLGKVDILVNNASLLGPRDDIEHYSIEDWNAVFAANVTSTFAVTKGMLGVMIPNNTGSIINVTSGVAHSGRARWGAYAASKAAVKNLSETLAEEVAPYNIRVNTVNPGAIRTAMRAAAFPKEDPATLPRPEDVVNAFIYLACDLSRGYTGQHVEAKDWIGRQF